MFIVGNVLIPRGFVTRKFSCQYNVCMGKCCILGDAGAPVTREECLRLEDHMPEITPLLDPEAVHYLGDNPIFVSAEHDFHLACLNGQGRCVFSSLDQNGVAVCVLEKLNGSDSGRTLRPISCRLFPIRIRSMKGFCILDYEDWDPCESSWCGDIYLVDYCRDSLIQRFGEDWFNDLQEALKSIRGHEN